MTEERYIDPNPMEGDKDLDLTLRPASLKEFVGHDKLKSNLSVFIKAALERREALDHVIFHGPPGLGKTTLANVIAKEMGSEIRTTSGPALERPADLAGILTNLGERDVLFIDEVHRLNRVIEEYLYPAMEDFKLDIIIDKGANARTVQLSLPRFTLVGATTRAGLVTSPLRARFGVSFRLDFYKADSLRMIIERSARILGIGIDQNAAMEIARRSRGTPRIANRLLRRIRDFAQIAGKKKIDLQTAQDALDRLDVDTHGLDDMDKRILLALIDKFAGGPVGLNTLAMSIGEEGDTIEEVYEPFLIQMGFISRTSRGRIATERAYKHFNRKKTLSSQRNLFD